MKTNKHYLMSAMNLIVAPSTHVVAHFQGDVTYEGKLEGLGDWAKKNNANVLQGCTSEGARHGLFPVILATSPRLAAALSVYSGYEVAMGDGRSFFTRKDARVCYETLVRAGVPISPNDCAWAISDLPYDSPKAPEPKPQPQETLLPW